MKQIKTLLNKYRRIILLVIIVLIVIIGISLAFSFFKNLTQSNNLPATPSSFFLTDEKGYYSLFDKDGKQLTDYNYVNANDFYNEVSKVKDKDSKYGIINEKGKYVVKMGTYANIYQYGSLFKVEEDSKYSLLNNKGKKIIKKSDFDVETFTGIDSFIVVSNNDKYTVYNYTGKKIYSFPKSSDKNIKNPSANEFGKFGSVYYDGLTIIFNIPNGKILVKIKEDIQYCISSTNEDESIIALNSCKSWYEEAEDVQYKVIINNKLQTPKEDCDKITINNDVLVCTINDTRYLLNKKLSKVDVNVGDISYQNYNNYAIKKDDDIEFIKNGKKVNTLKDAILSDKGYTSQGIYLTYKNDKYTYYNEKGHKLFKHDYKKATAFDKFGLAKVSDDDKNYYFINVKGKKVSPDFNTANINGEYYTYTNENQFGILSNEGKVLVESIYSSISIRGINDHYYAVGNKNDKEYELIDLATKKIILKTDAPMILYDSYITVSKDEKIAYYTYKGKEFNK